MMDHNTEVVLRINPLTDVIKLETVENGIHACKQISYDTMIDSIRGSLQQDVVHSGLLPTGCISYQEGTQGVYFISILHGERYADVDYMGTIYPHFPLPRLVFKFEHLKGHRIRQCWMGAVGEGMLTPDSPMYVYPFSNVNGFRLCTGNNVLPKCEQLYTLGSVPYYILGMPNNNDYFHLENNKAGLQQRDLMELLKDKDPDYYYSNILLPKRETLVDFIKTV